MRTIKRKELKFVCFDSWCRATYAFVFKTKDGKEHTWYFKDVTLQDKGDLSVTILNCSYDDIEGEPDFPAKIID